MDEDKKIEKIEEVEETTVEMTEKDKVQHNDMLLHCLHLYFRSFRVHLLTCI